MIVKDRFIFQINDPNFPTCDAYYENGKVALKRSFQT